MWFAFPALPILGFSASPRLRGRCCFPTSRDGVPGNPGFGFLGQGVGDFCVLVNLRTRPTPPPSTPKNIDLAESTPGSPQNPVLVLWGGSPALIFRSSGSALWLERLLILLLS